MKKRNLFIFLLFVAFTVRSQDVITLKNGDEINCSITEVGEDNIKYFKIDSLPVYVVEKKEVFMIKRADGLKEVFPVESTNNKPVAASRSDFMQGLKDGERHYPAAKCGAGGTFLTTVAVGGILGLIPAIACSSTHPKFENLGAPDKKLLDNENYMRGYRGAAHQKKKKKIWTYFGAGCVFNVATFFIITKL